MENEIVRVEDDFMPVMEVRQAVVRRAAIVSFVQQIMVDGTDFGVIPGTNKPTLLKPGAEKLTTFFGLSPVFVSERITENFGDDGSEPLFFYRYRCELYRKGTLMGTGIGSCNSRESKYRYRNSERTCPNCGKQTIIRGKADYGGGWLCFAKKGGCGAKFNENDRAITEQVVGKVPNPDVADLVNTIDKMAQKRALISATLIAVNASEFFTQDVEDMPGFVDSEVVSPVTVESAPKQAQRPAASQRQTQPTPTPPQAPENIDKARKAFMAQGVEVFGSEWDHARHWLIRRFTTKETPDNIRESATELTSSELVALRRVLVDYHKGLTKAFAEEQAAQKVEMGTALGKAADAPAHDYESPFLEEADAAA